MGLGEPLISIILKDETLYIYISIYIEKNIYKLADENDF